MESMTTRVALLFHDSFIHNEKDKVGKKRWPITPDQVLDECCALHLYYPVETAAQLSDTDDFYLKEWPVSFGPSEVMTATQQACKKIIKDNIVKIITIPKSVIMCVICLAVAT